MREPSPPTRPLRIETPGDPRIAAYACMRERDLVGREGRFIAEGEVVVRLLARRGRFAIESLLLGESRLERLRDVVDALPPHAPVYTARQEVLDAIVGFPIHRGVLAVGLRGHEPSLEDILRTLPPRALLVGLVGLANHDNVGGVFRNAAAFGANAVLIDPGTCDPLYRKAIRVSAGACLVTPFARAANAETLLEALRRHGFEILALSPSGAEPLRSVRRPDRVAVLLGTEGPGLPASILAGLRAVRIPMAGDFDSLNVATTSGVVLHHLAD